MLRQLQEELFELDSVPWVASWLRVTNQSSRGKHPERGKGWMRRRINQRDWHWRSDSQWEEACWKEQLRARTAPRVCTGTEFERLRGPWKGAQFWGLWGVTPLVFYPYTGYPGRRAVICCPPSGHGVPTCIHLQLTTPKPEERSFERNYSCLIHGTAAGFNGF